MPEVDSRSAAVLAYALRAVVKGEVLDDPFSRSLYSTDASIYEVEPLVIVYPVDEQDVRASVKVAAQQGVPVTARGAGSGLAGEALSRGIVLDFSARMNRIVELDIERRLVTVQPGVVLDSLNRGLARHGLRFGPDPSSSSRCTIGGMIANNASGARSLKYGDTRQNVVAARVCLADSTVTVAQPVKLASDADVAQAAEEGLTGKVHRELPDLLRRHAALIAERRPKVERNRSGYLLHDVLRGDVYDLPKLICGCEGTLGIVTEAVLKVVPLPGRAGMAVVYFDSLLDAARAVPFIRETQPIACELLDARLMALGRQARPDLAHLLPDSAKAILILEYDGADDAAVAARLSPLPERLRGIPHQSFKLVTDPKEQSRLWATRTAATPLLYRRPDTLQPTPMVEDAAVRPERLADYVQKADAILKKYGLDYGAYAHAGSGEVHIRPMLDLRRKEHLDIMESLAGEMHAAAWECEGTISGEHGEGLARAQWIERQAGPELYAVFKQVKALFDPAGILNPDKKITGDPHLMVKNLRFGPGYRFGAGDGNWPRTLLNWADGEFALSAEKCNGCAQCRSTGPEEDMCPRFRFARLEHAAPRARGNILRRLMSGRQKEGSFGSREINAILDSCFNCKLCIEGCPSGVNIPKLALEAKARRAQERGLPLDDWFFTTIETWMRLGQRVAPLANALNEMRPVRWLMELVFGVDRRRPLPPLKHWRLRRQFTPTPLPPLGTSGAGGGARAKVVYYPDLFPKYNAPEIAQAAVDVLEHNGFEVELPDVPWCNMPALDAGALRHSRRVITEIARTLAPFVARGIPIVTTEPTACLCMREEFLYFVDTPATRALSRQVQDIGEFLMALHTQGKLRTDLRTLPPHDKGGVGGGYGYSQACHHKALRIGVPGLDLVRMIPGVNVVHLDEGCCGGAGTFGMRKQNHEESMRIGHELFKALNDPARGITCGLCESSACRMQMEYGSGKPVLHPIQVLAAAYGYAPAVSHADAWDVMDQPHATHA